MTALLINRLKKKIIVGRSRAIGGMIKYPLRQWMVSTATNQLDLQIVTRNQLLNRENRVFPFGAAESIAISPPFNHSEIPSSISNKSGVATYQQPFVCEVADAELVGPTAVGFNKQGQLISETVTPSRSQRAFEKGIPMPTLILKNLPSFGVAQIESACSLVNYCKGYSHWLFDCLTRLEGLEYYQQQTGIKPTLIVDAHLPKWKQESLLLLGYDPDQCLRWEHSRLKVKHLVVSSFRNGQRLVSPAACRWLRQRFYHNLPESSLLCSPRIYISRPQSAGRHVINEAEVLQALAPWGFKAYTLEKMSFADQVRLFSQAEMVVAPHGAGLANIAFAENLSGVIEIFGACVNPLYFRLSKALGAEYGCLTFGYTGTNQVSKKYSGITVDVPKLRNLVADMT